MPDKPVPPPPSAEELYHAAEVVLAAGDRAAADRVLARILTVPGSALAIDPISVAIQRLVTADELPPGLAIVAPTNDVEREIEVEGCR